MFPRLISGEIAYAPSTSLFSCKSARSLCEYLLRLFSESLSHQCFSRAFNEELCNRSSHFPCRAFSGDRFERRNACFWLKTGMKTTSRFCKAFPPNFELQRVSRKDGLAQLCSMSSELLVTGTVSRLEKWDLFLLLSFLFKVIFSSNSVLVFLLELSFFSALEYGVLKVAVNRWWSENFKIERLMNNCCFPEHF